MIAMADFFHGRIRDPRTGGHQPPQRPASRKPRVDCGLVIADLFQTNKLEEGTEEGDFDNLYPGYHWEQDIAAPDDPRIPVTNGLFHVEYLLSIPMAPETNLDALIWSPTSKAGDAAMKSAFHAKLARAFTLLEIMVALALLSVIIIAIYSTWFSIVKGSRPRERRRYRPAHPHCHEDRAGFPPLLLHVRAKRPVITAFEVERRWRLLRH